MNAVQAIDAEWDCGKMAFVTGNDVGLSPDNDDVDEGYTQLLSPQMDLGTYATPHINFARSFFCYHGPGTFDDTMSIYLLNGTTSVLLQQMIGPEGNLMEFDYFSFPIAGLIPLTNTMQLQIVISDLNPNVNITEGGLDHFSVTNQATANVSPVSTEEWIIYPNPTSGNLFLKGDKSIGDWAIFGTNGQELFQGSTQDSSLEVPVESLQSGMYLLRFQNEVRTWVKQ
jgi:hypothetical protein